VREDRQELILVPVGFEQSLLHAKLIRDIDIDRDRPNGSAVKACVSGARISNIASLKSSS
jgi:hypothetical protein